MKKKIFIMGSIVLAFVIAGIILGISIHRKPLPPQHIKLVTTPEGNFSLGTNGAACYKARVTENLGDGRYKLEIDVLGRECDSRGN